MKNFIDKWLTVLKIILICIYTSKQVGRCVYFDFELSVFYVVFKGKKYELIEDGYRFKFEPMF